MNFVLFCQSRFKKIQRAVRKKGEKETLLVWERAASGKMQIEWLYRTSAGVLLVNSIGTDLEWHPSSKKRKADNSTVTFGFNYWIFMRRFWTGEFFYSRKINQGGAVQKIRQSEIFSELEKFSAQSNSPNFFQPIRNNFNTIHLLNILLLLFILETSPLVWETTVKSRKSKGWTLFDSFLATTKQYRNAKENTW